MSEAAPAARGKGPLWPWIAPFAVFIILLGLEPYMADAAEALLDPRWLYGLRAAVTAAVLAGLWRYYTELRETPDTALSGWLLGVGVGVGVFVLWVLLDFPPLTMGEPDPFDPRVGDRLHLGYALTRLAGAALVVPVMEELFWRSFLMRWLENPSFRQVDPRRIGWKPLLITSAVFAVEHRLWFAGLVAGLLYGELYRRTGDLRVVVLAHAITNALLGVYVLATGHYEFW